MIKLHKDIWIGLQVMAPPITVADKNDEKKLAAFTPIPNKEFASDHIPLGAIVSISQESK